MDSKSYPAPGYTYFFYHPEGDGLTFYRTAEERDAAAADRIRDYLDDTWSDEVMGVFAGTVTHVAAEVDRADRPADLDAEGCDGEGEYWPDDCDYKCNYALRPASPAEEGEQ